MELPGWKLQGFSGKPVKTLQYAAADLQGMDALPRAKLGASRERANKNHAFCAANRGDSLKKSRMDFFRDDYISSAQLSLVAPETAVAACAAFRPAGTSIDAPALTAWL